jgi:predicted thioredoxin/glutaredoxin
VSVMLFDEIHVYVDDYYKLKQIHYLLDRKIFSMIVHEVMMLKNDDHDDYVMNYLVKMELFHMHYHNDHHENLVNKIVVVEVRYHFQQKVHNVMMEEMKLLFEIHHQIPKIIQ